MLGKYFFSKADRSRKAISSFRRAADDLKTIAAEAEVANTKEEKAIVKAEEALAKKVQKKNDKIAANKLLINDNLAVAKNIDSLLTPVTDETGSTDEN